MKGKTLNIVFALIIAMGLVWFFVYNQDTKPDQEDDEPLPDIPPPPVRDVNSLAGSAPKLFVDSGQGLQAIQARAKSVWKNREVRNKLIRSSNASSALFNELKQPSDMESYFVEVFGGISEIPLTPPVVDGGDFVARMDSIINLTDFETQSRNGLDSARNLYERAATLTDGTRLYVPDVVAKQVHVGIWGPEIPRRKDRDASLRNDRHADDFKLWAANAANYVSRDLNNALLERATADLANAGYQFAGYVQA